MTAAQSFQDSLPFSQKQANGSRSEELYRGFPVYSVETIKLFGLKQPGNREPVP